LFAIILYSGCIILQAIVHTVWYSYFYRSIPHYIASYI